MGIGFDLVDRTHLVRLLVRLRPELRQESHQVTLSIADLLLQSKQKSRQHNKEAGHMVIYHQEIYEKIGKGREGFDLLTTRHRIFESPGKFSVKEGSARAFKVADDIAAELTKYFNHWTYRQRRRPHLLTKKGKPAKLDAAIASLDANERYAKAQGKALVANYVAIDVERIKHFDKTLKRLRETIEDLGQHDLFAGCSAVEIDTIRDFIGRMMESTVILDGQTVLLHHYVESEMGRLYAQGLTLQTIKREIKNVVLQGYWDYDIENCHYTILHHLAGQAGLNLPSIGHYLGNKAAIRQRIADEVGITLDEAKTCLTMLIYGAHESHRDPSAYKDAIPRLILDAAERLYKHPVWAALKKDLAKGRGRIIKTWPQTTLDKKTNKRKLVNALGKTIEQDADNKVVLAHLLQGVEAKMLEVVRLMYPNTLELLQHDGFVSRDRLDMELIEEAITEATGFVVSLVEKRLQPSADYGLTD